MSTEHDAQHMAHDSERSNRQKATSPDLQVEGQQSIGQSAQLSPSLLLNPSIQLRGNQPARQAAILHLQQTHGNNATRRMLQRTAVSSTPGVRVQRVGGGQEGDAQGDAQGGSTQTVQATPLNNIDDLIALVERVEKAYPGDDWRGITTRIRKSYYDGPLWNQMISDRASYPGLAAPPLRPEDHQAFATAKNKPEINVNGQSIDIGHIFTGLDAKHFPKTSGSIGTYTSIQAPAGASWSGDVGSALAMWDLSGEKRDQREKFYNQYASEDDMLGDADGLALSDLEIQGPEGIGGSDTLSNRLRSYYKGTGGAGKGASKRFTKFAHAATFKHTGKGGGIKLTDGTRQFIRAQVDDFAVQFRRKEGTKLPGRNWFWNEDIDWYVDHFVKWVEKGLAAENP